jgi:Ice-binding-like
MNRHLKSFASGALLFLLAAVPACETGKSLTAGDADHDPSDAQTPVTIIPDAGGPDGAGTGPVVTPHPDAAAVDTGPVVTPHPDAATVDTGAVVTPHPDAASVDTAPDAGNPACVQAPVALGAAGAFAVLAGSTVTNTGPSALIGDLGVSPGTAVTGFGPGTLVGNQHAADPTAAQAQADLTIAFNDAAGRTLCAIGVAGNLGGRTLTPGLYKSGSSLEISSGDLTLDAQGNANAVFIFQMASTLTTSSARQVILAGGARAGNVFWQVGSSATLGSTSAFEGNILADQAISLTTGATLNGRALARIAAVTLDSNSILKPAP